MERRQRGEALPAHVGMDICRSITVGQVGTPMAKNHAALRERTAQQVIEDHLHQRTADALEEDLARNYSPEVLLLSYEGISRGHEGVRRLADILQTYLPDGHYDYHHVAVAQRFGYLEWTGKGPDRLVHDGTDSYVVENGWIVAQTIHYSSSRFQRQERRS